MAEQPLATDKSAQSSISELKKIAVLLGGSQVSDDKQASDIKETKEGTEKIATSAVTFTKILGDMKGLQEQAMDLAARAAKAALRLASKIDPSKYMKAMADKTKKFAGDLLGLLMKGGVLIGLALLLEWLANQDWEAWWNKWGPLIKTKWEEFKTMFTTFYNDFKEVFDALSILGALAVVWKAAAWLGKLTSPIVLLMGALLKIFAVGTGTIALLLVEITAWIGKKLFGVGTGVLSLLWNAIKLIFGGAGSIFKLIGIVTEWVGKKLFDVSTGVLSLLWNAIKLIFGGAGHIFKLIATVTGWLTAGLFDVGKGVLSLLWNSIKLIFGGAGHIATLLTTVTDWAKTTMFGEGGPLQKAWGELKKIFSADSKLSRFLTTVTDWGKKVWFDDTGPIQSAWKKIKAIFSAEGKLGGLMKWVTGLGDIIMFDDTGDMRKSWKWIKGIFGPTGKIQDMLKAIGAIPDWFDESGEARKAWKFIKGMFGPAGKIQAAMKAIGEIPDWFDDTGFFRKMWVFVKGIFGPEGKIKKAWDVISGAADWWGDRADLLEMWKHIKGIFGAEGKIAKGFTAIKKLGFGFFDEGSTLRKVFTWFGSIFGKDSAIGKFITKLGGWATKFGEWFGDSAKKGAKGVNSFFDFFGDIIGKITGFAKRIAENPIVKGIKKFFGIAAKGAVGLMGTIGKVFAPIGWIMAIFEGIMGFWDGFKEKGDTDTRTFGEKMADGLKGALKNLVDFFVIDMAMMIQDILNWAIEKINDLGGWIPGFDGFEKFTFAEDLQKGAHALIDSMLPSSLGGEGDAAEKVRNQAQLGARMNLQGLGLGQNVDDEFMIEEDKLKKMMAGMGVTELARMATKLQMVEARRGISSKGGGAEWETILEKRLEMLTKAEQEQFKGTAVSMNNPQNFYTAAGGGGLGLRIPAVDQSPATKAAADQ